ncbi:hypothetical protein K488DRAFT_70721, partial [Vararia minispora EC-137]
QQHFSALLALSPVPSRNNSSASINLPPCHAPARRNPSPSRSSSTGSTPTLAKKLLRPFRLTRPSDPASAPAFSSTSTTSSSTSLWGSTSLTRVSSASSDRTARPTRLMLNGRTYGAAGKRRDRDLFASARDDEPAFVEWGQAGMGAVAQHSPWARIRQSGEDPLRGRVEDEDKDDGSGMAWVRRRRAEKEREKAREKAEREGEVSASSASSTTGSEGVESDGTEATAPEEEEVDKAHEHDVTMVNVKMPEAEEQTSDDSDDEDEDDVRVFDPCVRSFVDGLVQDADADDVKLTTRGAGVEVVSRHHH